ncbi:MAG: type VI secretion system baseplate subunit TssG [Gemmatimonadaceae bacterium]|nr:type VI secretion system baseplate subunit TssG [Gemmatimonadaceae bacterium]
MLDDPAREALLVRMERIPGAFEFAQLVRLLAVAHPGRTDVGGFGDPSQEAVRFGVHPSLAFPPGDVERVLAHPDDSEEAHARRMGKRSRAGMRGSGGQPFMEVNFLGLIGPAGVLPKTYTQYAAERTAARDTAFRDFLDLFHHRLVSLFYRAWRATRPHVAAGERADDDILSMRLRGTIGIGSPALEGRLPIDDAVLLRHAALLAPHARSATALRQLLVAYLEVPVVVEEFVPAWYPVGPGTQCALGEDDDTVMLGLGTVVGDMVLDHGARARVHIGPMPRALFDSLLPGTRGHEALKSLVRFVAGDAVEVEVRLVLRRDDVPATTIGAGDSALGWGTWLRTRRPDRDPDDTTFLF